MALMIPLGGIKDRKYLALNSNVSYGFPQKLMEKVTSGQLWR
jgi:hypothetical protein